MADALLQLLSSLRGQSLRRPRVRPDRRRALLDIQHRLSPGPGAHRRRARGRAFRARHPGCRHTGKHGNDPGPHPGASRLLGQRHRQDAPPAHGRGERGGARGRAAGPGSRRAGRSRGVEGGAARDELARCGCNGTEGPGENGVCGMKPEVAASGIRRRAGIALPAVASLASPAFLAAQEARGVLAGLAAYEGADRHQRLLEGARREGFLSLYTSFPPEDVATLNAAFERKYGVKVRAWRAASEKVLQRTVAEAQAGRDEVDLVDSNSVPLELLRRQGLLQAVRSPYHADLIPVAVPAHREWVWARVSVFVQAYNTRLIKQADLPASYGDLLDPRWKGKLGLLHQPRV